MMTRRMRLATGAAVFGGLLVIGGATRWYVATRDPQIVITYPAIPSPNAFNIYTKAAGKLVHKDEIGTALTEKSRLAGKKPLTLLEKETLVSENAGALSLFREGLRLSYSEPLLTDPDVPMPYLAPYRAMARLLRLEGDVRAEKGDVAGALASYLDAVQFGQAIPRGGAIISRLVGVACEAIGRRSVWKQMDSLDAKTAKMGAQRMEVIVSRHVPYVETMSGEKRYGQLSLRRSFHDINRMARTFRSTSDDQDWDRPASIEEKLKVAGMYLRWPKQRIYENYVSYMDALIAQAALPYGTGNVPLPEPADPANSQLYPVFNQARLKVVESGETQNALLTVSLALRAYRTEHHGALPEKLSELCPAYLSRIPDDPFAPVTGTSLRYRRAEQSYTLYSVGPDGKDNSGTAIEAKGKTGTQRYFVNTDSKGDVVADINIY